MAFNVIMPRQGQSVESCIIGAWHKSKGDQVNVGDILFTYETDKATFDEEAKNEGILLEIFYEEGDDVECLETVCVIGEEGEDISQFLPQKKEQFETEVKDEKAVQLAPESSKMEQVSPTNKTAQVGGKINISPRARAYAQRTGADITHAQPTGANNRIMERDVRLAVEQGYSKTRAVDVPTEGITGTGIGGRVTLMDLERPQGEAVVEDKVLDQPFRMVKLSNVRKAIAKAMHASLANSAQLTLNSSFDATNVLEFRKSLKQNGEKMGLGNISITDIIIYAVSRTLLSHESMNAHYTDEGMALFKDAHVGVAVDTPRGLLVPTIFSANNMSLSEISAHAKGLFEQCRTGSVMPDQLKGGTFTISNLGTLGVESFTPVINPPQTGILGVCAICERTSGGRTYSAMGLSLTFDHRALDGADAARFLKDLVTNLENFSLFLAK